MLRMAETRVWSIIQPIAESKATIAAFRRVEAERREVECAWESRKYRKYARLSSKETLQAFGVLGLPVLGLLTLFVGAEIGSWAGGLGSWAGVFVAYGIFWFVIIRRLYE